MNIGILYWKRVVRAVLFVLLLSVVGLTKSLAQEWQTQTLIVNNGTDLNEYIPFYGQFNSETLTYSQFIIPASDLTEIGVGGIIRSMSFYCDTENLSWDTTGCYSSFEAFMIEVPFDKFENFELYNWYDMFEFYNCYGWCLSIYDNQMTIENWDYYYNFTYNGGNLLIGIKPNSICQTNICSWYGINEEAGSMSPSASIRSYTDEFGSTITEPLYFKPKMSFGYIPPLTVNDGTDTNQFVPFNSQFNNNSPTYSQFIIPASDLSDMVWGDIKSLTFSCDYDEGGGGEWLRDIPNWENDVFEVRIAEVNFDKFEALGEEEAHFEMYNWDDMTLIYQGGLSVTDHQLTIPIEYEEYVDDGEWGYNMFYDYYQYEGDNLLIGIKPISVSNEYYYDNSCSWLGLYESGYDAESCWDGSDFTSSASLTYHTNYENYNGSWCHYENVTTPSHFMPQVTFRYNPDYAPSCLKPKNLEANDVQIHKAIVSWTGEGQFFTLQYKKSSEEWDTGHYGYDENWNWVWFEGTTKVVEGITENQYIIDSLESQTSYDVRVKAVCGAYQYGNEWEYYDVSNWSRTFTFSTIRPVAPTRFYATDFDTSVGDSVTLHWEYNYDYYYSEIWEPPTYWDIAYTTNMDALPDEIGYITINNIDSLGYYYKLTGLIPFTSYKAWIRASFGDGDVSDWSEPVTFKPTNLTNSVSIHDTPFTNNYYIPFSASTNSYMRQSQFIIPASSLSDLVNLEIWKLAFVSRNWPYDAPMGTIDIYLAEVETDSFDDAEYYDWETMEKVFHGTYGEENRRSGSNQFTQSGVIYYETLFSVTFDAPYYYEGGNLLIGVRVAPSYYGGYNYWWMGCQTDYNAALAGGSGYYSTPTQYAFLPWTYIYYSNSCQSPHDLVATVSEDDTSVTLSWAGEGENYRLCYWSQTVMTPNYLEVTGTSYELTDLPRDIYFWSVQTLCGEDVSSFVQGPSFLNVDIREPQYNDSIYEIYTPGELIWIERVVNGTITEGTEGVFPTGNTSMEGLTVRLMNDIDLHDIKWKPIGYYTDYDHYCFFNGIFDGNNHIVTNLYINQPSDRGVGFIGALGSNGEIHNVGIEGESSINGQIYVGGIVGYNGGGDLWNVYSDATITGKEYVGGIVGYHNGYINQAYSKSTVTVNATESIHIEGPDNWSTYDDWNTVGYAGGIVGYADGNIKNTYNRGVVTSLMGPAGGLAGYAGSLSNSYSTGNVISGSGQGGPISGVVGYNYTNNYFLEGQYDHQEGGTSYSQYQMQSSWYLLSNLNGNQYPQPWKADYTPNTNDGYPILQWQSLSCFVTYTQPEHGYLSVINTNNNMTVTSGSRVAEGTVLTVTVLPNNYYELQSLTANGVEIVNNTLLVTESVEIMAVLVPVYYTVTYTQPQHGQLFVMNDSIIVESGSNVAGGTRLTVTVTPEPGYTLESLTANGQNIINNTLVVTESVEIIAVVTPQQPNTYSINATAYPLIGGVIIGTGDYQEGSTCTLTAVPNEGSVFVNWSKNDSIVSTNATYSFIVSENGNYVAHFTMLLPELHVTNLAHSEFVAGQQATISWTIQNDGIAPTPNGTTWQDRVWLSVENRVAIANNNPILLGSFDNVSALGIGESYTQTRTVNIPIDISGEYYLFVITDAYDCWEVYWENDEMQLPYSPPPYIGFLSNYPNYNKVYELSECEHGDSPGGSYSDNFFYTLVDIAVPLLPDLQVTSIVTPDNFFSGTIVDVTATITNLGEVAATRSSGWTDALYFATEPDFGSAIFLSSESHQGNLQVDSSYQVTFRGHIPLTVYGDGYFFVETDIYDQVYEHILNHNNVTMSDTVNIILTPPADLEPSELVAPAVVSTAEGFTYSYIINNVGAGNPNVSTWEDRVYLCQNADTLDATAVLLKTNYHYRGLQPGASYSVNETITLPTSVTMGNYYLYVFVDASNDVFEYLFEGNNLAHSSMINVICPDLQITPNSIPEQITGGYPLNLSYTLTNAGEGIINNRIVTDKIYISATGSVTDTIIIANIKRSLYLAAGQSLTVMCNDIAPYNLTDGTYHLMVVTDFKNKIKESNEGNNIFSYYPMDVLHQPLPDLVPVSLTLPAVIQAGETIPVQFDITNIGDLALLNSNCAFDVYATWNNHEILCPMQSQTMPLGSYVSIGINETMHFSRTILVPPTVTSACTTFELVANKGSRVPELDTTNNVFTTTVSVLDCPLPDFVVTDIETSELQAGTEAQITFIVHNNGTADFEGHFNTAVYVRSATDTISCPLLLQVSPAINNYALPMGEMLTFTQKVLIPPMADASCTLLDVVVDKGNFVLEANDDNNTTSLTATVINYPFDLKTTTLQVPESIWAGETTSLTWTVQNIGTCPSEDVPFYVKKNGTYVLVQGEILPKPWVDKLYVSEDAVLSDDDIELCSVTRPTMLQPNGTYSVDRSVTLPYTNLGVQYLLCVSDASRVTYDPDTLNNNKSIPVYVQLGSLPDLRITSLNIDEDLVSDRVYWLRYTVINEGERVTQEESWTDAFYIGETMSTFGAFQLGSKIHHGALEIGETYTDSIEVFISNRLEGNYFLMGFTDKTNQIYEHNNENDNLLAMPVTIMACEPSDLIAIQPEFPASVISGEEMTISWQLRNIGMNPSVGRIRNAVYLSTDAAWSSDDIMLGYANTDINIIPNDQQPCSLSGMLTSVPEGSYYVIVKVNILNALNETSYENNICVSMLTMEVGYPILAIGEQVDRNLATNQYIYYKLQVGPEYEGQTLSCSLITTEQQVANGLYLSHETVPTLAQYDFGQYAPYAQEIEILVPALEQGDYYLLVKGSTQNGSLQQVSIATSIVNFEILHVDTDHGSNTGSITTKITGAKFDSIMDFRLVQGSNYLPAEKVFFSNSTETFTTFDLAEMPIGTYAMEAELPGGIITIKGDAFTIEEGLPAELAVNIVAPSSVRDGTVFPVRIEYGNIGTTDLNVSGFLVISGSGHPIGFTSDELAEGFTELTFNTAESNSNPDVLRPGYRTSKTIFVKASTSTNVKIKVFAIRKQY